MITITYPEGVQLTPEAKKKFEDTADALLDVADELIATDPELETMIYGVVYYFKRIAKGGYRHV